MAARRIRRLDVLLGLEANLEEGNGGMTRLVHPMLAAVGLMGALIATPALAQEFAGQARVPAASSVDEILLKDGNLLRGKLLEQRKDGIVFLTESLGRLVIPYDNITRMALASERAGTRLDPDANSIMFCPTPATLPGGESYFRDFELFVLNFGFGVSDALDLSLGTLFPVSTDVFLISGGTKLRLLDRRSAPVGLALTGSYTQLEETHFGALGGVIGVGDARRSLNLAINAAFDDDGATETIFLIGGDYQTARQGKVFAEYFSSSSLLDDEDDSLDGFINIGFRIFGERYSFSLSGFRPLGTDSDGFIAFPMMMFSWHY